MYRVIRREKIDDMEDEGEINAGLPQPEDRLGAPIGVAILGTRGSEIHCRPYAEYIAGYRLANGTTKDAWTFRYWRTLRHPNASPDELWPCERDASNHGADMLADRSPSNESPYDSTLPMDILTNDALMTMLQAWLNSIGYMGEHNVQKHPHCVATLTAGSTLRMIWTASYGKGNAPPPHSLLPCPETLVSALLASVASQDTSTTIGGIGQEYQNLDGGELPNTGIWDMILFYQMSVNLPTPERAQARDERTPKRTIYYGKFVGVAVPIIRRSRAPLASK